MKVLWANENPNKNFGGTENHSIVFVNELFKKGLDIALLVSKESFVDKNVNKDVKRYFGTITNSLSIKGSIDTFKAIKSFNPDIVIANNAKEYPNIFYTAKALKKKVAFFRHMEKMKSPLVKLFLFPYVDRIYAVSEHVKNNLLKEGAKEERTKVIYNLIEEEKFLNESLEKTSYKDKFTVIFVGKIAKEKGIYEFISVAKELINFYKDFFFIVVGDSKELINVKNLVSSLSLEKYFLFTGFVHDVWKYYKMADLALVLSLKDEAFGRTALEAIASGLALIVSKVGGIKEALLESKNGFLVDPQNKDDIVQKILYLYKNRYTLQNFKENSIKLYKKKFSKDKILKEFIIDLETLCYHS